ncbi:unnamed protein product [Prorocentrum cordatum]|uniref:Uncharacterized protein n=1 Tax=Prorocentrum cordatum TaxID=2364126 RepID=A0ABN9R9T3_9DINO|nr:unnamed protein product [Polarella glacialis]
MARDIVDAGGGLATLLRAGDWASSAFEADGMKEGFATTWSPVGKELPPGHTDYSWEKAVAASKPAPAPAKKPKKVGGGAEASAKKAPEPPPVGGGTRDEDDDAAAKIALIVGRVTKAAATGVSLSSCSPRRGRRRSRIWPYASCCCPAPAFVYDPRQQQLESQWQQ